MKCRVHRILKNTKVEGPGNRYCIWFQGCSKRCRGCFNAEALDFKGGIEKDTKDITEDILKNKKIEGVTFLGGEPFEQFEALFEIASTVKKRGFNTLCFTGKKFEEIKKNYSKILPFVDILIDGEYIEEKKDFSRPWVGSSNQNYYFLSDVFNKDILKQYKNKAEINILKNGKIIINGMGDFKKITEDIGLYTNKAKKWYY